MRRVTSLGIYGTERAGLIHDKAYKGDGTKRAVIVCHGLNGEAFNAIDYPDPIVDEMAARGHMCMTPDLGGKATWGNDASQTKLLDAITYLNSHWGVKTGGVLLWAGSMGTLVSLNFMRGANAGLVRGVAVGLPAVDLADLHDNATARTLNAANIETAYGGAASFATARASHNPMENTAAYQSLASRIHLWNSSNDQVTIPERVAAFASATGISTTSVGDQPANGHAIPASAAKGIADFLEGLG